MGVGENYSLTVNSQQSTVNKTMQQTGLNLIAIGIFVMTLFSLLGPMLNISPLVPAIATAVIMGLATIDVFSWQGKGVNILLELFAGTSSEYRLRIVRHEAGHFLVAYLLDTSITSYALSAWEALKQGQPGQGGVTFAEPELTSSISKVTLDRYCTIWMAGIAAETIVYGSAEGGTDDRQQLGTVLFRLGRRDIPLQERWSILQAKTLIEANMPAYEALVTAMQQRASVEECCQVIQQHREKLTVD